MTGHQPIAKWAQEELTGAVLDGVGDAGGNYVNLLNASHYLTATVSDKVRRWRIYGELLVAKAAPEHPQKPQRPAAQPTI